MQHIFITEVHNFGGFFGGDTVTFDAHVWPAGETATWTIDEKAFQNIDDRYLVAADMLLDVELAGERVERAWVRAARSWETLKPTLGPPAPKLDAPQIRAYHCTSCSMWVLGEPLNDAGTLRCPICGQLLATA